MQQRKAGGVTFTLTRRRVKNLNLRVRLDGSVAVSAPMRTPLGRGGCLCGIPCRLGGPRPSADGRPPGGGSPDAHPRQGRGTGGNAGFGGLLVAGLCTPLPGPHAGRPGTGYAHPLGQLQPAHPYAVFCAAAVGDAARRPGICGGTRAVPSAASRPLPAFWAEVARCLPDYKARRAMLRAPSGR